MQRTNTKTTKATSTPTFTPEEFAALQQQLAEMQKAADDFAEQQRKAEVQAEREGEIKAIVKGSFPRKQKVAELKKKGLSMERIEKLLIGTGSKAEAFPAMLVNTISNGDFSFIETVEQGTTADDKKARAVTYCQEYGLEFAQYKNQVIALADKLRVAKGMRQCYLKGIEKGRVEAASERVS